MIDFDSALIYFDCERNPKSYAHHMHECDACDGGGETAFYLGTLFANIAIAAGLCAAFKLGMKLGPRHAWRPGCQRAAKGWGG